MPTLLDVFAIPRGEKSRTRKIREAYLRGYQKAHPDAGIVSLDLVKEHEKLPVFDEWDVEAKFAMFFGEGKLDAEQAARWDAMTHMTDQLHMANVILISSPMWNFSIPWMLKRWIDAVVQPRLTFEIKDGHFRGLLAGRRGVILCTRDSSYAPGTPYGALDYQTPYLKQVLALMGVGPIDVIVAEPLMAAGPQVAHTALENACAQAERLGASS